MIARTENDKKITATEQGISILNVEISFTALLSIPGRFMIPAAHRRSSRPWPRLFILTNRNTIISQMMCTPQLLPGSHDNRCSDVSRAG